MPCPCHNLEIGGLGIVDGTHAVVACGIVTLGTNGIVQKLTVGAEGEGAAATRL